MKTQKFSSFKKYSVIAMSLLALGAVVAAKPVLANEGCQHGHWDHADHAKNRAAFFEKRTTELHDKLQLTSTQEADWTTFLGKIRPADDQSARGSWAETAKLPAPERMEKVLAFKQARLQKMEARVEATKEFYSHLTTEQRQIFDESFQHHHHQQEQG